MATARTARRLRSLDLRLYQLELSLGEVPLFLEPLPVQLGGRGTPTSSATPRSQGFLVVANGGEGFVLRPGNRHSRCSRKRRSLVQSFNLPADLVRRLVGAAAALDCIRSTGIARREAGLVLVHFADVRLGQRPIRLITCRTVQNRQDSPTILGYSKAVQACLWKAPR